MYYKLLFINSDAHLIFILKKIPNILDFLIVFVLFALKIFAFSSFNLML